MKEYRIAGIGEILWDVFPEGKRLGGAPANFAFHAAQLGADSCIISRVGNDSEGQEIINRLQAKNIAAIMQIDPDNPTGKVTVKTDRDGSPEYHIHGNAAWDNIAVTNEIERRISSFDAICFGSLAQRSDISGLAIRKMILLSGSRCLKIFDINLRQNYYSADNLAVLMKMSDILKLNHEELEVTKRFFLSNKNETKLLKELKDKFSLKAIILTKGKDGSRIYKNENNDCTFKSVPVKVTDSVGAGDSFTAAAAVGFLKDFDLEKINKTASLVAAYVCTQNGATPNLPENLVKPFVS